VGQKFYAAAEKLYGAAEKLYGAADFQSATSIFQFFNSSILQFFNSSIFQFFNSSRCDSGAGVSATTTQSLTADNQQVKRQV